MVASLDSGSCTSMELGTSLRLVEVENPGNIPRNRGLPRKVYAC